jgi:SAM-dependent methyltransferase
MQNSRSCPSCGTGEAAAVTSIAAAAVVEGNDTYCPDALALLGVPAGTSYPIVSCTRCGFVYARELPSDAFLTTLYRDVIDAGPPDERWTAHQLELAAALLSRVAASGPARILDYGCGDGTIVKALHAAGIFCLGYEPHRRDAAADGITDSLAAVRESGPYSGVILSDVLEHVPEPKAVLAQCRELLVTDGWLCVSVPDFGPRRLRAIVRDLEDGRPVTRELNPWEHLNYFSPASLARMVGEAGLRVDAEPPRDFGFRSSATGVRRLTNALRSTARLLAHAVAPSPGSTTIFARR